MWRYFLINLRASKMRFTIVIIIGFALTHMPLPLNATSIHNEDLAFVVKIPEGFKEYDYLKPHSDARTRKFVKEQTLYAYNKGGHPEENNYTGIFLNIERSSWVNLSGLDIGELSPNTTSLEETWRGHKINLYRVEKKYTTTGDRMVTLNAVIPLKAGPIQIKLTGDVKDENEMRNVLSSILSTLDSEAGIIAYAVQFKYLVIASIVIAIGVIVWRWVIWPALQSGRS
jgi:hypothetical protein